MLTERLKAYSKGSVTTLNELLENSADIDAHGLAARLANGSPRDMIRACRQIVAEETRAATPGKKISKESVLSGVKNFSDERANELFGPYLPDFRRIGSLTYTINRLASEVFKVSQQAARAKIQKWQATGATLKSGEVPNPGNRPLHLYSISDPRLAIALRPSQETELILGNCVLICPSCDALCVSDRDTIYCSQCFDEFHIGSARSVLEN